MTELTRMAFLNVGRNFDIEYYSQYILKNSAGTWISQTTNDSHTIVLQGRREHHDAHRNCRQDGSPSWRSSELYVEPPPFLLMTASLIFLFKRS